SSPSAAAAGSAAGAASAAARAFLPLFFLPFLPCRGCSCAVPGTFPGSSSWGSATSPLSLRAEPRRPEPAGLGLPRRDVDLERGDARLAVDRDLQLLDVVLEDQRPRIRPLLANERPAPQR